jgi:Uma2 family endonuclease
MGAMGLIEPQDRLRRHLFDVDQYYRMAETGVLAPDAKVELIEGEIFDMAPSSSRHSSAVMRLNHLLTPSLADQAIGSVRSALRLSQRSEPQPDLMLLKPRADYYASAHPSAEDVLLLVEVSDTTARYDRGIKLNLYARHGVREVWIVDLDHHMLRTYRKPVGELETAHCTEVMETASPGVLSPQALPQLRVDLSAVLV